MHHVQREHWIERERKHAGKCAYWPVVSSLLAGPDYDSYFLWLLQLTLATDCLNSLQNNTD